MNIQRWLQALSRIPPQNFWSTVSFFLIYAFRQGIRASRREKGGGQLTSHINFKRAHYLEKAMLCEYPRSPELDDIHHQLCAYLASDQGRKDDCHRYLLKMAEEYADYPDRFRCFMLDIPRKPWPASHPQILRRLIIQRRSQRRFLPQVPDERLLERVIEAGAYAPTSCNAQPVQFLTITKRPQIDLVFTAATGATAWHDSIPSGIIIMSDSRHYKPFSQHMVMFQDIAAATQNCLLMAEALGLAACWVSLLADSHCDNQDEVYHRLNIPPYMMIGSVIAIGYPANSVCLVPRRPVAHLWHREYY